MNIAILDPADIVRDAIFQLSLSQVIANSTHHDDRWRRSHRVV